MKDFGNQGFERHGRKELGGHSPIDPALNAPSLSVQEIDLDGTLLLRNSGTKHLCALNETGRFIWERFRAGEDAECIAAALASAYDVDSSTALDDVVRCLDGWCQLFGISQADKQDGFDTGDSTWVPDPARNRFHWDHGAPQRVYRVGGNMIRVAYRSDEVEQAATSIFCHLEVPDSGVSAACFDVARDGSGYRLGCGDGVSLALATLDEVLARLQYEIVERAYRRRELGAVIHGGAVLRKGQALVMAGCCGAGKSTLAASLQQQGFDYLSDDVCPLEPGTGRLIPIPMAQAIKEGSWNVVSRFFPRFLEQPVYMRFGQPVRYLAPDACQRECWDRPWPVGAVIFPRYRDGASTNLAGLSPVQVLKNLLDGGALSGNRVADLTEWIGRTPGYSLEYSNLEEAAVELRRLCDAGGTA